MVNEENKRSYQLICDVRKTEKGSLEIPSWEIFIYPNFSINEDMVSVLCSMEKYINLQENMEYGIKSNLSVV